MSGDPLSDELSAWLDKLRLSQYKDATKEWCNRLGAIHVDEVLQNWEDFANAVKLKPLERKRVEKATRGEVAVPGVSAPQANAPAAPAVAPLTAAALQAADDYARRYVGPKEDPKRYALLEELGQGATATVYKCMRGDKEYACKTISLVKLRMQPGFQRVADQMRREVAILFALRHPRIVSLYDVLELPDHLHPEKLHLVMDLVQGGELFDKIVERGAFREPIARHVFLQITEGLKYIHSKDIVYRDLKPENVLVDEKASKGDFLEVKLSDFGHSKLINDGYSTALTRVGTPQYWAPEVSDPVRAARGYDQTVDLWSLGVVLYVMCIGAYPFDGVAAPIEEQIRVAKVMFRLNALGLDISDSVKDLIRALVKADPKDRLPLDRCLKHAWVERHGSGRLMKLCTEADPRIITEKVRLPCSPVKEQVAMLRRDLHTWMTKFHTSAKLVNDEIIATLGDESEVSEQHINLARAELNSIVTFNFGVASAAPGANEGRDRGGGQPAGGGYPSVGGYGGKDAGKGMGRSFKLLSYSLRVHDDHGAGLDLQPESGGMRIDGICALPGQPGLQKGDLITKINEVSMRGTPDHVEAIFGTHFCDGAQLAVRRAV